MFSLATGLDQSTVLKTLQKHLELMDIHSDVLEEMAAYLKAQGIDYFNAIPCVSILNESTVTAIIDSPFGKAMLTIYSFRNVREIRFAVSDHSGTFGPYKLVTTSPIIDKTELDNALQGVLAQGPSELPDGDKIQITLATDPADYTPK